jgi:hypothetical protein
LADLELSTLSSFWGPPPLIVGHQQLPLSVLPMFYYHIFIYKQT